MTVAGMILVNNGWGATFTPLQHSHWNGLTPCDLVFPFFLFIVGVSTYLSLQKSGFRPSVTVIRKIVKRATLLFLIGLFINWTALAAGGDLQCFDHLRLWAVLQRIAVCYLLTALFAISLPHRYLLPTIIGLLTLYGIVLLTGNGYAEDATNIALRIDTRLFGAAHLYRWAPIDPEGLLGTIGATAHTLTGFYCARRMRQAEEPTMQALHLLLTGAALLACGWLLSFLLPINKTIWSPSFALVTCGAAALLLGLLIQMIDIRGHQRWALPFRIFGVNPLALYASSELLAILLGQWGVSETVYNALHTLISYDEAASLAYAVYFVSLNFLIGYILYRRHIYIKL